MPARHVDKWADMKPLGPYTGPTGTIQARIGNAMAGIGERRSSAVKVSSAPLDSLTSLRFFAALAVVFYHSGAGFAANSRFAPAALGNILNNGWLGVPFFFILSGFILTYAHADLQFDRSELRRFFIARFSRLYPVYLLALVISIPFVDHFSLTTDWFQFFLLQSWFPGSGATDWNFVAWTLSVELFFYCVFPLAFVSIRALPDGALLGGLAATIGLLLLIWLNMTPALGDGELHVGGRLLRIPVPLLRLPEFIYGMFLGALFLRKKLLMPRLTPYAALIVIFVAAASSTSAVAQTIALLAFGPLILSLARASNTEGLRNVLETRVLVILGGASYALYLLQFSMRKYVVVWVPDHMSFYARIAFAPVLVCVSVFVFLRFEGPMRKWLRTVLD